MQYQTYLAAGYFIGSGVVEAGCKSVIAQRLKQSGMRWSVIGARHILTFRCTLASGLFDLRWNLCQPVEPKNILAHTAPALVGLN